MHRVWQDFSVSGFELQNILSREDCIDGKNKIALHVRTCVWCVLEKRFGIFREYLDLAIFYSDGHRCSTKEYFIYGLFLDWMSLRTSVVVGLKLQQIFFFVKYHSLFNSCYLAHTCISALNAHTFYQSTRRYLLAPVLGISPHFGGKGAIVKWSYFRYRVTQKGSEIFLAQKNALACCWKCSTVLFYFLFLSSFRWNIHSWSGRHNTLNYLHYVIDHHFLTLIDYTKMVDGFFDGARFCHSLSLIKVVCWMF